jgi:hypothetical protein
MTDTPSHIKTLQIKIWLSKSPMERLRQMMVDNESLFRFWSIGRAINSDSSSAFHLPDTNTISPSVD